MYILAQKTLTTLFEEYLTKQTLFSNKKSLTTFYTPETVPHRDNQINQLAKILTPSLRDDKPSNIFIYGSTGTGKTLVVKYVMNELVKMAENQEVKIKYLYVNCKMKRVADTEYRLLAYLSGEMGRQVPPTGLPTDQVYRIFFDSLSDYDGAIIFVIDEIDALVKKVGDDFLYNLTRIDPEIKARVSIIGISNDLSFTDNLDQRVKSSLSEEELIFPPYNALQLQDILESRAKLAFGNGVISEGVIPKCSALAAQEHGDARRALDLLRVAGELAERTGKDKITEEDVNLAEKKIDLDRVLETVKTQPKQSKTVLAAIVSLSNGENEPVATGDVFDRYRSICSNIGLAPLTQRRVSDLIGELEMFGIINAKVISKGRGGRTRAIQLSITSNVLSKIKRYLKDEFYL